jgi:hypothetical protein
MGLFNNLFGKQEPTIKEGDLVVCIDDRDWNGGTNISLKYGAIYKLLKIGIFCHGKSFDIGGRFINPETHTSCSLNKGSCNNKLPGQGIHWAHDKRFRKATTEEEKAYNSQSKENIDEKIQELVAEERYEEAAELHKQIE